MATRMLYPILLLLLITAAFSSGAHADKDFIIFDVRQTLPLDDNEKVYKDYYVDIGTESGVRVGSILAVYRRLPVIDLYRNKAQGDLVVPIGHLKVIASQRTMSVCRLMSLSSESQIPVVQYQAAMMGDRVEIAGSDDAGPAAKATTADGQAAPNSGAVAANSDTDRAPAATGTQNGEHQKPATPTKKLPKKKHLKNMQAKPNATALPIPAQT